jgi:hypothetical protein
VTDLKFGPLPKKSTVKVTIELPEPLEEELDAYATEHSKLYGPVETKALIPHMMQALLRADRGWRIGREQTRQAQTGRRRACPSSSEKHDDRIK